MTGFAIRGVFQHGNRPFLFSQNEDVGFVAIHLLNEVYKVDNQSRRNDSIVRYAKDT